MRNKISDGAVAVVNNFLCGVESETLATHLELRREQVRLYGEGHPGVAEIDFNIDEVSGDLGRHSAEGERNYLGNNTNNDNGGNA